MIPDEVKHTFHKKVFKSCGRPTAAAIAVATAAAVAAGVCLCVHVCM